MSEDRTAEFMALARSLPPPPAGFAHSAGDSSTVAPLATGRYNKNDPAYADLRNFHQTASVISKDIAATSHMLAELTQLVKSSTLFAEANSSKVNALVLRIKQSIENLNGRLDQANATLSYQKRRLNAQAGQEASNLVVQLKEEFVQTTAGFKKVLQERTDHIKEASDQKMQVYGGEVDFVSLDNKPAVYGDSKLNTTSGFPTLDLTTGMSAGEPSGSTLPRPREFYPLLTLRCCLKTFSCSLFVACVNFSDGARGSGGGSYHTPELRMRRSYSETVDMPIYSGSTSTFGHPNSAPLTPFDIQRMEEQMGQQVQLIPDQTYLRERADAMSTVEANIVELGTIFNKLAVMVSEHKDLVQRVEDNVEEANTNLSMSMNVLTDTLTNLRTNRALMTKVFSVLVFFIIMFIIFFA
jgi:syntaxin 5